VYEQALKFGRSPSDFKLVYRAFPLARNSILVRFENLADLFDGAEN